MPYPALPDEARALITPHLVVFMDRVRENVRRLIDYAGGPDRLRIHVKTTKMPEVWRELFAAGIRHYKCATPRELAHLLPVIPGGDVLVAYAHRGSNMDRIAELARAHPDVQVAVAVEDPTQVVPEPLGVFVDINGGMNRTGIPLEDRAAIDALVAHPRFRGLHCYEGHVVDGAFDDRKTVCEAMYEALLPWAAKAPEVVTSGTPSFIAGLRSTVLSGLTTHRVSPGTVVFHDQRTDSTCEELDFQGAAYVLTRVISHPRSQAFTCDAGSKALATDAGAPVAVVEGRPEWVAGKPSEEHLPFHAQRERPARGEHLLLFPRHVCPTVNLAETAALIDDDHVRVVPVIARAH